MMKRNTLTAISILAIFLLQFFPASQNAAAAVCDSATFIADVTVPDGSGYSPNADFTKTWRLKNSGTCTWDTNYKLVFASGVQMNGPSELPLTTTVAPGATVDLSVNLTAPVPPGTYKGFWMLKNAAGTAFGIGSTADKPFWVAIVTRPGSAVTPVPVGDVYNFASPENVAQSWVAGGTVLPFPGKDGDLRGFALRLDSVQTETGATVNQPTLLTVPQSVTNGYIQGLFPSLAIQAGDRFRTTVGCQFGATTCYVTYRIDYRTSLGTKTLWKFNEKYEGLTYNVDLDLSFLAGRNVEFFLLVLANGSPAGDRALWINPHIVRTGGGAPATITPIGPTVTGTPPTPVITDTPGPVSGCDRATFVADVTVPDGTIFGPNAAFTKTWRLKNGGTCTWTTAYKLVFASGAQMGAPSEVILPTTVAPGATVDLSMALTAPAVNGSYRGYWQLKNASGGLFGIGSTGDKPFWVDIVVQGGGVTVTPVTVTPTVTPGTPAPTDYSYNFAVNGGAARWLSGAGTLPFPGTDGDPRGFALKLETFQLETGVFINQPSLLMVPQNKVDGYVQGVYPALAIQAGDRFQTTIGCQYGATACYVTYRIDYRTSSGTKTLWSFKEKFDSQSYNVNLDLSFLAGKNTEFFLLVLASGSPTGDRAVWVNPRIVHAGSGDVPPTPSTSHANWLTYTNTQFQFQFQYPPEGQVSNQQADGVYIGLPVVPGTNLVSKYLQVRAVAPASSCSGLSGGVGSTEPVTFNGIAFNRSTGESQGAGQIRQVVSYYTVKGNVCVGMDFVLHSGTLGAFPTSIVQFNFDAESAVFAEMMSTFAWLGSASTGSYAVTGVASNDGLNVHSAANADSPVVASLAYNATDVLRVGSTATTGTDIWWEVQKPGGGMGWVNSIYLTEYVPELAFCRDARVTTLLKNLGSALKSSSGTSLAALVNTKRGLDIRLAKYDAPVNFSKAAVASIFSSTTSYNWGSAPGAGDTVTGTFKDVMLPKLQEVYNSNYVWTCDDPSRTGPVVDPWPYLSINFYSVYKPATPGVELDWRNILAGIEYVGGQPYLFALVNYQWEP